MQHPYPTPHISHNNNENPTPPGLSPQQIQCHSYQQQCLYVNESPVPTYSPTNSNVEYVPPTIPNKNHVQYRVPPYIPPPRFSQEANHLLSNIQETLHQPPTNMLLSTVDINLKNIREWEILDSGASSHFLVVGVLVTNKQVAVDPISVTLSDGDQVHSTHIGDLDMPQLPKSARLYHIIPDLTS